MSRWLLTLPPKAPTVSAMRMLALGVLGIGLVVAVPGAIAGTPQTKVTSDAETKECVKSNDKAIIYGLALRETLLKDAAANASIVLLSTTSGGYPPGMAAWTSMNPPSRKELLDAAEESTKRNFSGFLGICPVPKNIDISAKIDFVTPEEMEKLFPKGGGSWTLFTRKYKKAIGFTLVSNIAFNESGSQALVYIGHSCGDVCGGGYLVLLAKDNRGWSIVKTANIWAS